MNLKKHIRIIKDFPKEGISFKDVESLLEHPEAFDFIIRSFAAKCMTQKINKIVALDARGFIFGGALAREMGLPMVMVRKKGKLPGETLKVSYDLEYGTNECEMHVSAIKKGDNVLMIDDLLATGGSAAAATELVKKLGGHVAYYGFVIELKSLRGRSSLAPEAEIVSLVKYED